MINIYHRNFYCQTNRSPSASPQYQSLETGHVDYPGNSLTLLFVTISQGFLTDRRASMLCRRCARSAQDAAEALNAAYLPLWTLAPWNGRLLFYTQGRYQLCNQQARYTCWKRYIFTNLGTMTEILVVMMLSWLFIRQLRRDTRNRNKINMAANLQPPMMKE